jgi:hypothetical protein
MSYCPECGLDFDEGMSTCPDCRVELVDIFPQADERDPFRDFKPVFLCYSMDDAMLVQTLVDGEGIPVLLSDLNGTLGSKTVGLEGQVWVHVPHGEAERAVSLIEEAQTDGVLRAVSGEFII